MVSEETLLKDVSAGSSERLSKLGVNPLRVFFNYLVEELGCFRIPRIATLLEKTLNIRVTYWSRDSNASELLFNSWNTA